MMAARAWAEGRLMDGQPGETAEALADARLFAFDAETVAAIEARLNGTSSPVAVWLDNAPIVEAFLIVCSQWRTVLQPFEGGLKSLYLGFDYAGARVALDAMTVAVTPDLWNGLAVMENAAAAALNGEVI